MQAWLLWPLTFPQFQDRRRLIPHIYEYSHTLVSPFIRAKPQARHFHPIASHRIVAHRDILIPSPFHTPVNHLNFVLASCILTSPPRQTPRHPRPATRRPLRQHPASHPRIRQWRPPGLRVVAGLDARLDARHADDSSGGKMGLAAAQGDL